MSDPLSEFEERLIANVSNHGCHINVVRPTNADHGVPFAYSVGFLETVNQPEIIVFGLSGDLVALVINDMLHKCREGLILSDGVEVDDILEGHKLVVRQVLPEFIVDEYLNSAIWYEQRRTGKMLTQVMQLVWPGPADGLFPWDDGCDESVRSFQPALYKPSSYQ